MIVIFPIATGKFGCGWWDGLTIAMGILPSSRHFGTGQTQQKTTQWNMPIQQSHTHFIRHTLFSSESVEHTRMHNPTYSVQNYIRFTHTQRHIGSVEMEMMESGMVYQQTRGALTTTECFSCRIKVSLYLCASMVVHMQSLSLILVCMYVCLACMHTNCSFSLSHTRTQSLSNHQSLVTAVLHSRTPTSVDTLRCQFNNCLQRLKHTLNDTHILPGAGRAEAQCIHSIKHAMEQWRVDSSSHSQLSSLPAAIFRGSWMGDGGLVCEWRDAVCGAFVNGLKRYMVQVELNCRPGVGYFVAMTTVQSKIETCNEERWREEMLSWKLNVFDVKRSKRESWKRAVQLLRMVFLSTKMDIHINDMY